MDEKELKERLISEVKNTYLNQIREQFVDDPYSWQVKMTLINMVIINLSAGKRRELFKYDEFCKEILRLSDESFEECGIENTVPSTEEFMKILLLSSDDMEKSEEMIEKLFGTNLGDAFQRLEGIIMRKILKDKFGEDFSESHVEFVDKFYNKNKDYKEMYSFVKEKFHENKSNI